MMLWMRPVWLVMLGALALVALRPARIAAQRERVCPEPATATCLERAEEEAVVRWPQHARRNGAALSLQLDDGRGLTLTDSPAGTAPDSALHFRFADYLPRIRQYVVRVRRPTATPWVLIDARTGRETVLDAAPIASPDGSRFATVDAPRTESPPALHVWVVSPTGPAAEWTYAPAAAAAWTEVAAAWFGPNRLRLVTTEEDAAHTHRSEHAVVLVRGSEGWRVAP